MGGARRHTEDSGRVAEGMRRDLGADHLERVEETSEIGQLSRVADWDINSAHPNIELHPSTRCQRPDYGCGSSRPTAVERGERGLPFTQTGAVPARRNPLKPDAYGTHLEPPC